jgi:hypothetical protein
LQISGARFSAGPAVRQFETAYAQSLQMSAARAYDVSPDAQRFLMLREHGIVDTSRMRLIAAVNWFEELKTALAVN